CLAAVLAYEGADRDARIADGARKEGEVNLYTSLVVEDVAALAGAFEKKHGVKVKYWRAGSEKVVQRLVTEAKGGRFDADVIEAKDSDWFATIVKELGEERGLKLFRDIVATNGISVRKGHSLLAGLVASGEVPFALTVYSHNAEKLKQRGAPIDWYAIPPAVAR